MHLILYFIAQRKYAFMQTSTFIYLILIIRQCPTNGSSNKHFYFFFFFFCITNEWTSRQKNSSNMYMCARVCVDVSTIKSEEGNKRRGEESGKSMKILISFFSGYMIHLTKEKERNEKDTHARGDEHLRSIPKRKRE